MYIYVLIKFNFNELTDSSPLPVAVHCGYLFLVLWAGLTAGRALPINTTDKPDADVQSVIADLQVALNNYGSILNKTVRQTSAQQTCSPGQV